MKKKLALLMCLILSTSLFAGCGSSSKEDSSSENGSKEEKRGATVNDNGDIVLDNVSYVLVYNPQIYDEFDYSIMAELPRDLNTGDMSSQIMTGQVRGGLGDDIEIQPMISQADINAGVDSSGVNRDGVKAGGLDPVYKKGDAHEFWHHNTSMTSRVKEKFDCVYEGDHCYIWALNGSISESDAAEFGKEFDTNIYEKDVKTFGKARFTENGGKVNMLFYDMPDGIGGFFTNADIYSSAEAPTDIANANGLNTDHAIININRAYVSSNRDFAMSTMTHEFQHLICMSDIFNYAGTPTMKTWLNESMSAYAEEMTYPGIKEQGYYNQLFYFSDFFRSGQSLYNFNTNGDDYIGAYGIVYLYSQYLSDLAGDDVFSNIHDYWRNSYSDTVTEAEAIHESVPKDVAKKIDDEFNYPAEVNQLFNSEYEEWMSKLTLSFYIETISMKLANLEGFEDDIHMATLYTNVSPADIEGGGRILIATKGGSYTIPGDADNNILYIGLDENFEVCTDIIYK